MDLKRFCYLAGYDLSFKHLNIQSFANYRFESKFNGIARKVVSS